MNASYKGLEKNDSNAVVVKTTTNRRGLRWSHVRLGTRILRRSGSMAILFGRFFVFRLQFRVVLIQINATAAQGFFMPLQTALSHLFNCEIAFLLDEGVFCEWNEFETSLKSGLRSCFTFQAALDLASVHFAGILGDFGHSQDF
jgi:hypothetical protein